MKTEQVVENWWKKAMQRDKNYYKHIYKNLKFDVTFPVLEIGGGSGSFLNYIEIKQATILDIGGKNSLFGNYDFIAANITKRLPDLGRKFSTIFLMEVLEHIENPLYLMAQVYDLLKDEGICYISVPYTLLDLERKNDVNPFNCHVCRWKINELTDQMSKLGFLVTVVQKRRRFKNTAFYLPHCWIVLKLRKIIL